MSGLYIHIPFCKSRCIYCGFYSSTENSLRSRYVEAICQEMKTRRNYLKDEISTIYLGGGTPSLLSLKEIDKIFNSIYIYNNVESCNKADSGIEVTMECNPDDITPELAKYISESPINRVSMGVQTFSEPILHFIRRRHTAEQAINAVHTLRKYGVGNISIDLMFGFPNETKEQWSYDLDKAVDLNVEHISAYSLMYEEGTPLYRMLKEGKVAECNDDDYIEMYNMLIEKLTASNYEHYEISNFSKTGYRSRHNSNYWKSVPYLGIGASAHSYNEESRQWNVANVKEYIESIDKGLIPAEIEELSISSKFDDTVMTRLRTCEGIDLNYIKQKFGDKYFDYLKRESEKFISQQLLKLDKEKNSLSLTKNGIFLSDSIMSDLMYV